jgi:hypothetical protein
MVCYNVYRKRISLCPVFSVGGTMSNRFALDLSLGESATVCVFFDIITDDGTPYVDFENIEVMYKGVDIVDTLDLNDLASLDKQIMTSWDLIEKQAYEDDDGL